MVLRTPFSPFQPGLEALHQPTGEMDSTNCRENYHALVEYPHRHTGTAKTILVISFPGWARSEAQWRLKHFIDSDDIYEYAAGA